MDYLKYNEQYANNIINLLNQQYLMPYSNFEVNSMINKLIKKLTEILYEIQNSSNIIIVNKLQKYTNSFCVIIDAYVTKYTGIGPKNIKLIVLSQMIKI